MPVHTKYQELALRTIYSSQSNFSTRSNKKIPRKKEKVLTNSLLSTVLTTISSGVYWETSNRSFRHLLSPSSWMSGLFNPSSHAESWGGLRELFWVLCVVVLKGTTGRTIVRLSILPVDRAIIIIITARIYVYIYIYIRERRFDEWKTYQKKKEGEERKRTRQQTIIKKKKKVSKTRTPTRGGGGWCEPSSGQRETSILPRCDDATNKRDNRKHDIERKKLAHETGERDSCASKCSSWLGNDELEGLEARFAVACHTIARFDHSKP